MLDIVLSPNSNCKLTTSRYFATALCYVSFNLLSIQPGLVPYNVFMCNQSQRDQISIFLPRNYVEYYGIARITARTRNNIANICKNPPTIRNIFGIFAILATCHPASVNYASMLQ